MNRRRFWQSLGVFGASIFAWRKAEAVVEKPRPEPQYRFFAHAHMGKQGVFIDVDTEMLNRQEAEAFLNDSLRDMKTIMAQGKVYPKVEWPEGWEWKQ